jgi:hypothetical protein
MTIRRDHVAGGAFIAAGAVLLAVSGDLPFGTLASPGAGMLPKLAIALMMALGLVLLAGAGDSPRFGDIAWGDLPHAVRVVAVAGAAIALYESVGFLTVVAALLFALTFAVERQRLLTAAVFSVGVTALAYLLFNTLLKSPLPRGILGY